MKSRIGRDGVLGTTQKVGLISGRILGNDSNILAIMSSNLLEAIEAIVRSSIEEADKLKLIHRPSSMVGPMESVCSSEKPLSVRVCPLWGDGPWEKR
jgi:hypothetical protein